MEPNSAWFWLLLIWSVAWKGPALWRAARLGDLSWFIVLLVVQTAGILDILYVFVFSRRKAVTGAIRQEPATRARREDGR